MAARSQVLLRLFLVGPRAADRERADRIVDGLAERRPVSDGMGDWRVIYDSEEISEAMRMCEADLAELDPGWLEILDFAAVPLRRILRTGSR
jgi:hypothetical protein